ncbi:TPA: HAD-IIA family hydrolase [Candidatus Bipolaricaulota bacterium]|nr:HAD-IIA family hydrolase [Candidatus Bipolaricaulota bacterium]HIP99136.1 HAD-IIA family hydrolase [Candidatus Bipolaricaulota bacterium]
MLITGYLLDLDGTVWRGEQLIPGAREAIGELRRRGRRIVFLSNKPLYSRRDYADKLTRLGIPTSEDEVINSSFVLARLLARAAPGAKVFAIGEPPLLEELERAGLEHSEDPEEIEYVIAAFDRTFHYRKLNIAFQALQRGARFWATNPDRTCPVEDGEIPDAAGVIAALEATTGRQVELVVGKPSPHMVQAALEVLSLPPERCAMVGDRLETDMRMAKENGLSAILTLTGVTRREDLEAAPVEPDHVIESIAELPALDEKLGR